MEYLLRMRRRSNGEKFIQTNVGFHDDVSVLIIQGINQKNKSPQPVSSFHVHFGYSPDYDGLEVFCYGHIICTSTISLTQLFESKFSDIFRLFLTFYVPALCYLCHTKFSLTIICELIPNFFDVISCFRVTCWIVITIHAHRVQKSVID